VPNFGAANEMAAHALAGPSVLLPGKASCRTQQRSNAQRQAFGSTFVKGTSGNFAGQSLRLEASTGAGSSRKVTTMAAKGERGGSGPQIVKIFPGWQCARMQPNSRTRAALPRLYHVHD